MKNISQLLSHSVFLVMCTALFWGTNFAVVKVALQYADVYTVRLLAGVLSLVVYAVFLYPVRHKLWHMSLSSYGVVLILSIPIAMMVPLLNFISLSYIDGAVAILLIYTMPAMHTFFQALITLTISGKQLLKILFCLVGVFLTLNGNIRIGTGEIFILSSALVWSIGGILNDHYAPKTDPRVSSALQLIFGTILSIIACFILYARQAEAFVLSQYIVSWFIPVWQFWGMVLFIGIFGVALAFICWFTLMKKYGSQHATYSIMLVPVVGVVTSFVINNEPVTIWMIIGLVCMMISMAINSVEQKKLQK